MSTTRNSTDHTFDQSVRRVEFEASNQSTSPHPDSPINNESIGDPHLAQSPTNQSFEQLDQRKSYQIDVDDPDRPIPPNILHQLTVQSLNQTAEDQYTDITAAPIQYERSTLQWFIKSVIPSILSFHRPIQSTGGRMFDRIIRTTLAMLIAAIISSTQWARVAFVLPYLSIAIALMLSQNTVGGTIMAVEMAAKATLFSTVIDIIILAAGAGSIQNDSIRILVMMLCIFFGALLLTYHFTDPIQRRLALVYHCAVLIQSVELGISDPKISIQLWATLCIGGVLIILFHCIPFPRLAKDEVIDRWRSSSKDVANIFNQAINAALLCEPIHANITIATARQELAAVSRSISVMRRLLVAAQKESSIFHLFFPMSVSFGGVIDSSARLDAVNALDQQSWIVSNLLDAIEKIDQTSDLHRLMSREMRTALRCMQDSQTKYLTIMSSQAGDDLSIGRSINQSAQKLKEAMQTFESAFVNARIRNYRQTDPSNKMSGQTNSNSQLLLHDAIAFLLGRYYLSLSSLKPDALIDTEQPLSDHLSRLQWRAVWRTQMQSPMSWSFFGLHPIDDIVFVVKQTFTFLRRPTIDLDILKIALKLSIIVGCASLIGVIPQIKTEGGILHGLWCAVTAAILVSDSEGMAWWRAVSRIYGTVFGGFVAYLILLTGYGWAGLIGLLMCWCIIMQLLQSFPRYLYLAQLGQITALIVIYGKFLTAIGQSLTIERFALERMTEITLGCCIYLFISTILWPVSSLRVLRSALISSVQACEQATMSTVAILERVADKEKDNKATDASLTSSDPVSLVVNLSEHDEQLEKELTGRILSSAGTVSMLLAKQDKCLFDAATEPRTLLVPVPEAQYRTLMASIKQTIQTIIIVEPALRQISSSQNKCQSHHTIRVSHFYEDLRHLIDHIHDLFVLSMEMLRTGQPIVSKKAEMIGVVMQQLRVKVATAIQDLSHAVKICKDKEAKLNADFVPIATLLWGIMQLATQTLILELNVRRLMMFERPKGYVD